MRSRARAVAVILAAVAAAGCAVYEWPTGPDVATVRVLSEGDALWSITVVDGANTLAPMDKVRDVTVCRFRPGRHKVFLIDRHSWPEKYLHATLDVPGPGRYIWHLKPTSDNEVAGSLEKID